MRDTDELHWEVVENGLDYLSRAVAETAGRDEDLKYAVLHLYGAIETIVKARLAREHWTLTVAKIEKAKRASYLAGDFASAGAQDVLARLRDVVGVPIKAEHLQAVSGVGNLRNRAAHFALGAEPTEAVRAALGAGLHFLLWFLETQLRPGAPERETEAIDDLLDEVAGPLGEIDTLVRTRMAALQPDLTGTQPAVECARCRQVAMLLTDDGPRCRFCLHDPSGEDAADAYASEVLGESAYRIVKQGGTWLVHDCLTCSATALVEGVDAPAHRQVHWACFACGFHAGNDALGRCSTCGQLMEHDTDGLDVCADCLDYAVNRE